MSLQHHNPPHPGALIQRTYIEPFAEMTGNRIADRLGVERSSFDNLLSGVSNVSPEMASRLSSVLGGSAKTWIALQENYDLWKARQNVNTKDLQRRDSSKVA
jgi:antitoxin HigA-1